MSRLRGVLILLGAALALTLAEFSLRAAGSYFLLLEDRASSTPGWESTPNRILCLGESTTAPAGHPDHSWPRQLEGLLNDRAGARRFAVINAAHSSTNSAVLLARLPDILDRYHPRVVVAMMGINDSQWYGVLETARRRSTGWRAAAASLRLWRLARYVRYELLRGGILRAAVRKLSAVPAPLAPELGEKCRRLSADKASNEEVERACVDAATADPNDWASHYLLVERYLARGRYVEAEQLLRRAGLRAPFSEWYQVPLAEILIHQGKSEEAERLLTQALASFRDPNMVNSALISLEGLYSRRRRPDLALDAYTQVVEFESRGADMEVVVSPSGAGDTVIGGLSPVTVANYRRLRRILAARGIPLVVMQYPTRPLGGLPRVFIEPKDLVFVENVDNFKEALRTWPYSHLFRDRSYTTWGHCTSEGDRLIADAVFQALAAAPMHNARGVQR